MLATVEDILKDTSTFAYRKVYEVQDVTQLYKLISHPDPCVRLAAVIRTPLKQVPCFIADNNETIQKVICQRLNPCADSKEHQTY